jgi:cytosine/uracil/thiamine/allantoin permease
MGPIHNILSSFTVVGFFALGLSAKQVVAAILLSAVIVSAGYVLNGQASARYGVPFAMLLRDSFGSKGALIPAAIRGTVAGIVFFGPSTVSSAQALDVVMDKIFPGYADLDGSILGLAVPTAISYLVMWAITVALFLAGQRFLGRFSTCRQHRAEGHRPFGACRDGRRARGLPQARHARPVGHGHVRHVRALPDVRGGDDVGRHHRVLLRLDA